MVKYIFTVFFILFLFLNVSHGYDRERRKGRGKGEKCPCGTSEFRKAKDMIINGKPVDDMKKYPFIVSLHPANDDSMAWGTCGGALISKNFVLTAAHCVVSSKAPKECIYKISQKCFHPTKSILVGLLGEDKKKPAKKVAVKAIIIHPKYEKRTADNDIALIKLKEPVPCSAYTRPICITKEKIEKVGAPVSVAGWGRMSSRRRGPSDVLREGVVKTISSKYCKKEGFESVFCTIGTTQSSCEGDSGTAVFTQRNGRFFALGVTSTHSSLPFCAPTSPVTFAKIAKYFNFISRYVKDLEKAETQPIAEVLKN